MRGWKIAVLGGAGAMGALLASTLRRHGANVWIVDRAATDGDQSLLAEVAPMADSVVQLLGTMDAALLCLPEAVTLSALPAVCAALPPSALVVDTNSTKGQVADLVATGIAAGREYVSLNPMFAPSVGWAEQNVAAIAFHDGPRTAALLATLGDAGARVTRLSADEHDRTTSAIQCAVHAAVLAFGDSLHRMGHSAADGMALSSPPYRTLMAMLARIAQGQAHVYHDIQEKNPHAAEARAAVAASAQAFAVDASLDAFEQRLGRIQKVLGSTQVPLAQLCARLFAVADKE